MQARTEPALVVSDTIYRLLTVLPQSAATSVASGMMKKGCDLAITNVPYSIALYASGAEVQGIVPFAPKGGAAANLGLMTYNRTAYVGINVDTLAIPDPGVFLECIRVSLRRRCSAIADPDARAVLGPALGCARDPRGCGRPRHEGSDEEASAGEEAAASTSTTKAPAKKAPAKRAPATKARAKKAEATTES